MAQDRKPGPRQAMTTGADGPGTAVSDSRPKPTLRCFIAASARVDLTPIRDLLEERGITAVLAHEAAPGLTIVGRVTALIAESDLMLAILDQGQSSANVTFELGYAYALNKKILVILPPDADPPADLATVFSIRATIDNREAISFALDQLLAAPSERHQGPVVRLAAGQPIGALADHLLARADEAVASGNTAALEQIVAEAIRAGGPAIVVEVQKNIERSQLDMAVWSDDLETWVGNPLLIEVKLRLGAPVVELVRRQMESYIKQTYSRWALVLYADGPARPDDASLSSPPVLFMRVDQFLRSLRSQSLAETVKALRNAAVHGVMGVHGR